MMVTAHEIDKLAEKVDQLRRIALELEKESENFPAINRNTKRIVASIEMLRVNLPRG